MKVGVIPRKFRQAMKTDCCLTWPVQPTIVIAWYVVLPASGALSLHIVNCTSCAGCWCMFQQLRHAFGSRLAPAQRISQKFGTTSYSEFSRSASQKSAEATGPGVLEVNLILVPASPRSRFSPPVSPLLPGMFRWGYVLNPPPSLLIA